MSDLSICLIGFGEVGRTLAADLAPKGVALSAWDVLFANPASAPSKAAGAVRKGASAEDAAKDADIVLSAVTAAVRRLVTFEP